MSAITEEEKQKLVEFREKVGDLLKNEYTQSDIYLLRWLRARELNLETAETMIRNHYKWRAENKIDTLLAETPDNYFHQNYKYWLNGEDIKGRPVLCIGMGDWDIRRIVEDDRVEEFTQYMNRMYERIVECIIKANERRKPDEEQITQFTCIVDWDRFTGRQTASLKAMQTMLDCGRVYEAHYPEILGHAFFINTNPFFQIFFALMKPILAPRTLAKVHCFGSDREQWEPAVRELVQEHQIPRQFGG